MVILKIVGTSGSGKSTLVRNIMALYTSRLVFKAEGRKQPIGYLCSRPRGRSLAVLGHYESPCGGCDTISSYAEIYRRVRESASAGHDVLFEGLLISGDFKWTAPLVRDFGSDFKIVGLTTPIDECVEAIMDRRRAKAAPGAEVKVLDPKNTQAKFKTCNVVLDKLYGQGAEVHRLSRESAFIYLKTELDL